MNGGTKKNWPIQQGPSLYLKIECPVRTEVYVGGMFKRKVYFRFQRGGF